MGHLWGFENVLLAERLPAWDEGARDLTNEGGPLTFCSSFLPLAVIEYSDQKHPGEARVIWLTLPSHHQ